VTRFTSHVTSFLMLWGNKFHPQKAYAGPAVSCWIRIAQFQYEFTGRNAIRSQGKIVRSSWGRSRGSWSHNLSRYYLSRGTCYVVRGTWYV